MLCGRRSNADVVGCKKPCMCDANRMCACALQCSLVRYLGGTDRPGQWPPADEPRIHYNGGVRVETCAHRDKSCLLAQCFWGSTAKYPWLRNPPGAQSSMLAGPRRSTRPDDTTRATLIEGGVKANDESNAERNRPSQPGPRHMHMSLADSPQALQPSKPSKDRTPCILVPVARFSKRPWRPAGQRTAPAAGYERPCRRKRRVSAESRWNRQAPSSDGPSSRSSSGKFVATKCNTTTCAWRLARQTSP